MSVLADYGIRPVTDPARIAAAEERLREFSLSDGLSLEQAVAVTREMDIDAEAKSVAQRTSSNKLLVLVAFAGTMAFFVARLFGFRKPIANSSSNGGLMPSSFGKASKENANAYSTYNHKSVSLSESKERQTENHPIG